MKNKLWIVAGILVLLALLTGALSPTSRAGSAAIVFGVVGGIGALLGVLVDWRRWAKASPEEKAAAMERERVLAIQRGASPTLVITSKEVIAFRFLLLIWGVGLLSFGFAAFCYFRAAEEQKSVEYYFQRIEICQRRVQAECPTKNANDECDRRYGECGYEAYPDGGAVKWFAEMRDVWGDRVETSLYVGIAVIVLSSFLFYGIRWGLTGRLKPLWPLRRAAQGD